MTLTSAHLNSIIACHPDALRRLKALYHKMDAAYDVAARSYGFLCRGCENNCCRTRFYHHTLIEVAGLLLGYRELSETQKALVLERARAYYRALQTSEQHDQPLNELCPLNVDEQCLIYQQRPMICRLHGIPHAMQHPARGLITGTGCHKFEASCSQASGHPLDRTPLYSAMAMLEQSLRRAAGIESRVRLTIAEMILVFEDQTDAV
jgi:Fe-S-cluster containining protein